MILIGDVHQKHWKQYLDILSQHPRTVQIGDLCIGRKDMSTPAHKSLYSAAAKGDHRFIKGNRDHPLVAERTPFCIPDGTVEDDIMFIGGARSPNHETDPRGLEWWPEEEASQELLDQLVEKYARVKPRVMITHDGPHSVVSKWWPEYKGEHAKSRTAAAFDQMLNLYKPDHWIFGHHHVSRHETIDNTRFRCLALIETMELP
jgi:hypothetical protein